MGKRKLQNKKLEEKDVDPSVSGGLRDTAVDSRTSGGEPTELDEVDQFKIAFNDKEIICESRGTGHAVLVFTHGAGGGITSPAIVEFAQGFATKSPVVCFRGTMSLPNRVKTFHAVLEQKTSATALGGRSMGARAAVLTALECHNQPKALVLVSYPLTGGKAGEKREPEKREQILLDLPESMDVLFVVGSGDSMCDLDQLAELRQTMSAGNWLLEVNGADHGMSLKPKSAVQPVRRKTGSIAAEWLIQRDNNRRYCCVAWDPDNEQVVSDGWTADPEREGESATNDTQNPRKKKRRTK